ncbi:putative ubiquitin-conjugating enzyme E2 25 [Fulvia fulva]|uniref:Ubiquitin-conjugating enzyme E2 25 n=1 Tax=Passalora fulva TaxID=5499 RepID=A0A9Q8P792_PASFU|nr:putative ubiquitin-conjugating enzyme E2 25 [Fulvia fulva]KAK4626991.1 putative ubiquitin-conjugating enzyme E2 25 [Fulvia fulva]KAK4628577.1 putative ubiquitin-conjugating enzyme E2 25 [Fulvia fulva]UJO15766.1 putative ubiquitin-conjugating enzyme E2 25 [Fulvia fulva]WPV14262.1 putative ubiquitin-conjugating enzyme E2 25 [Fulvia fulva]WPV28718.1 putative ubiquitin-conjugating enzyme E2 25 [Fulvia fulva]
MERVLHPDDIVYNRADSKQLAVVERTHDDIETHQPFPGRTEQEPIKHDRSISHVVFRRFMKDGVPPKDMVLVRWQLETTMELLPTSKVALLDRSLLIGDIVKRSTQDAMSGVVLNTFTKCTLQPMCDITYQGSKKLKGILPPGKWQPGDPFCVYPSDKPHALVDIPASELQYVEAPAEDDLVIYNDWIGRVEAVTNQIRIKLADNCVVELMDELGEHADGTMGSFFIGDIAKAKKGQLRMGKWIFGQYNPNTSPVGTVVSVRTVTAEVTWLQKRIGCRDGQEPPFTLESTELESQYFQVYDRSRRPRESTSTTVSNSEIDVRLNLRVRFNDLTGACLKYSGTSSTNHLPKLDRSDHLGYDINVFDITSFRTDVTVQWQDLSITTESSVDLVLDPTIEDEHAAWPGEVCHTLGLQPVDGMNNVEQPERVGVVQSVQAADRMAKVRWCPGSYIHYSRGPDDENAPAPVLAHEIRASSEVEEEISLYDIEAPGSLNVRRGDVVLVAEYRHSLPPTRPQDNTWLGEIVDTPLDGTLVVRLGAAAEVRDIVLTREEAIVAVRSDGTGDVDAWDNGMDEDFEDEDDFDSEYDSELDDDEYDSELEADMAAVTATYEDELGRPLDEDEVEDDDWESAEEDHDDDDVDMQDAPGHQTPPTSHSVTPADSFEPQATPRTASKGEAALSTEAPTAYAILDGDVPSDHHYHNEPSTSSAVHMKRTQKEHKILRNPSTLPQGVYIRSWETRLDLLRVLLVGPTETPYENAPFVVDFYLPPTFPSDPPQAFFHSWPALAKIGAIGRVNPNLYEDGKICLSLLGTWDGNKLEAWNAARSTLLQVIVSLLGLVLVREPYYNEAGYEALVGSEASKRPSALYSERIFLRSKGFLITALANTDTASGLKGLEDVIGWLYRHSAGPKLLDEAVKTVEEVLRRSEGGGAEPDGLTVMSRGASVSLRRALTRLQELQAQSS